MNPSLLNALPFLAIFAPILLFWNQVKNGISRFIRLFWHSKTINSSDMSVLILNELNKRFIGTDFGQFAYKKISLYNKETGIKEWKFIKSPRIYFFFRFGFIPIIVTTSKGKFHGIKINCFRGVINIDKLIAKLSGDFNSFNGITFYIKRYSGELNSNNSYPVNKPPEQDADAKSSYYYSDTDEELISIPEKEFQLDFVELVNAEKANYSLTPRALGNKYVFTKIGTEILQIVKRWLSAREFYQKHNIRWYRGCCLYSVPGCGKSSLILEIARELNIPLFVFDLASMSNTDFIKKIEELPDYPGIIVFEDLDCIFNGRNNITKTEDRGGLTHDCLINMLSGSGAIENKFVFITTNNLDKLDDSVLRAGRMDSIIELPNLGNEERRLIAERILHDDFDAILEEGKNDTTAEFENRCVTRALEKFWA